MFRLYRKTIYPRWHVNRKNSSKKKSCARPKALVLSTTFEEQNHSNQDHRNKQHAHKQYKHCWDDPQFYCNFFKTSVETAGWLGTVAVCFNYHFKHINSILEYETSNSSCLFSNIVLAMPRRSSESETNISLVPDSISTPKITKNLKNDKVPDSINISETIKTLSEQYAVTMENFVGVKSINKNDKKAFHAFQSSARHGSSAGFYNLGLCYQLGKGTKVNLNMAAYCYRKAAMKGHGLASFNLAIFFYKGIGGVPADTKIAKELLAEAAKKDVPEALLYFGILYLEEKRWPDAVKVFSCLAEKNMPDAQYYLGLCYENGLGVKKNGNVAAQLFQKSADQGNKRALYKLQSNKRILKGIEHPKFVLAKSIERNANIHVSASVPELSAIEKKSNQNAIRLPILSYLDLFTPFFGVKSNDFKTKTTIFADEKKLVSECSSTFVPFKSIPVVMMQAKT